MKKLLSLLCALALILGLAAPALAVEYGAELNPNEKTYAQSFSDVPPDHWAFQYVGELVERGAINGYPDGKYYPDKIVTREEFAKIMVVAAGLTAAPVAYSSYTDVDVTYWASPFIETAKPYMTAYQDSWGGTSFHPKDGALREDIAVAVVKLKGYDTRLADLSILQTMFSDVDGISAAAQPYVALAVENGIISGYLDGTFRGQATITRSEAAAMLWRAFQYGNDNKVIATEATPEPSELPKKTIEVPKTTATPEPSQKPSTGSNASSEPTSTPTPMPTATPEPAKPYVAETLVKNVEISDTDLMMTMDDDSNLIFYNAKSDQIVSLDPDSGKTTTLLDVSRATVEVPVEPQAASLSALEEEGDPPAAEAAEPPADEEDLAQETESGSEPPEDETEEDLTQEPEPEVPSTVTYQDLTVYQVFWDDVAGRLLVWGEFASIKNDDNGGWTLPNSDKGCKGLFTLENGDLSYFAGISSSVYVGYFNSISPRSIQCALSDGTFVIRAYGSYATYDYADYIFDVTENAVITGLGRSYDAVFQSGSDIYALDGAWLKKYDYGTGDMALMTSSTNAYGNRYANGKIYCWDPDRIWVVRPSDGAEQTKLDPSKDVDILDLRPMPSRHSLRVTADEQYLFYDSDSNAIRVIRPNPKA